MAKQREYAYQIKGNKLSIIEKDFSTTDGLNYVYSGTAGDGITDDIPSGSQLFKSPLDTITNGIEIEYSYSPEWSVQPYSEWGTGKLLFNGWTVVDGYLTLLRSYYETDSFTTDSHILVTGSDRWNGIHKVKEVQGHYPATTNINHGALQTYTRVNQSVKYFTEPVNFVGGADHQISGILAGHTGMFSSGDVVWISGSDAGSGLTWNNGLFILPTFADGATVWDMTEGASIIKVANNYDITETVDESVTIDSDTSTTIYCYEAFRDPGMTVFKDVDVLNDEDDTIDLPPYLSRALVYYVKAKAAEDTMQIDVKEYLMKEFRKMVEKHENSKIAGPRRIMPGVGAIR
tara:strand:+ start:2225 stop:3262 length:1038 start_codon:yes stop_codon:yes gene_type:complete